MWLRIMKVALSVFKMASLGAAVFLLFWRLPTHIINLRRHTAALQSHPDSAKVLCWRSLRSKVRNKAEDIREAITGRRHV